MGETSPETIVFRKANYLSWRLLIYKNMIFYAFLKWLLPTFNSNLSLLYKHGCYCVFENAIYSNQITNMESITSIQLHYKICSVSQKIMIKIMLKWRKESNTYLTTVCRHRWSTQITMKVDKLLQLSSAEEEDIVFSWWKPQFSLKAAVIYLLSLWSVCSSDVYRQ